MEVFFKIDLHRMLIMKNDFEMPRDSEGKQLEENQWIK